jgi:hypothetical protein
MLEHRESAALFTAIEKTNLTGWSEPHILLSRMTSLAHRHHHHHHHTGDVSTEAFY